MHARFILCCSLVATMHANDRPIIGILSQESISVRKYFSTENYRSYIAASYVKYLESAGARVVPVWIGQDKQYYKRVIDQTNGIFFPGGSTWFNESNGYGDAGQLLYDIALKVNENGDYYPIWGTCLGMELLGQAAIGGKEIRVQCSARKISLPLIFEPDYYISKLFAHAPKEIVNVLSTENVTYNSHIFCFTKENFTQNGLDEDWRIMSTNTDIHGLQFISAFESKKYPFYGVQFHPEKNQFEFKLGVNIPHSPDAIKISNYFANFFVEETRKNNHSFKNWEVEHKALIYNYSTTYTGVHNSSFEQIYLFTEEDFQNNLLE